MPGFDQENMRVGKRKLPVQLPNESLQEYFPAASAIKAQTDRGKPVTFNGSNMALCAVDDEIVGFIEAVELPASDGRIPFGCQVKGGALALDAAGDLVVGDTVVAAAPVAAGTHPLGGSEFASSPQDPAGRVKKGTPSTYIWIVWEVYGTGADRPVYLRRA